MNVLLTVNGERHELDIEPRRLLGDVLRRDLGLFGVHFGCEHGVCGACTVSMDGRTVRSCLVYAVQAEGHEIETVEHLDRDGDLHPVQQAFSEKHGLQCGFCTPAFVLAAKGLLERHPDPDETLIREELAGNICRCTGYVGIVEAVRLAAERMRAAEARR